MDPHIEPNIPRCWKENDNQIYTEGQAWSNLIEGGEGGV